jgi:hypothetical protein
MRQKGNITLIVLILVIIAGVLGYFIYQNTKTSTVSPSPSPTSTSVSAVSATTSPKPTSTSNVPAGWKTYKNSQYKFEFSYPDSYKVLTDDNSLSGWPDAILLLYKGGQSYDLAVELWDTEAEYKAKYTDTSVYTVFKTEDGKFITLSNQNKNPEVAQIISTFKFTD